MDNSYKNVETGEIIDVAIVTLPPSLSDQNEESSTTFQPFTDKLPPIPSSIILRKDGVLQVQKLPSVHASRFSLELIGGIL